VEVAGAEVGRIDAPLTEAKYTIPDPRARTAISTSSGRHRDWTPITDCPSSQTLGSAQPYPDRRGPRVRRIAEHPIVAAVSRALQLILLALRAVGLELSPAPVIRRLRGLDPCGAMRDPALGQPSGDDQLFRLAFARSSHQPLVPFQQTSPSGVAGPQGAPCPRSRTGLTDRDDVPDGVRRVPAKRMRPYGPRLAMLVSWPATVSYQVGAIRCTTTILQRIRKVTRAFNDPTRRRWQKGIATGRAVLRRHPVPSGGTPRCRRRSGRRRGSLPRTETGRDTRRHRAWPGKSGRTDRCQRPEPSRNW